MHVWVCGVGSGRGTVVSQSQPHPRKQAVKAVEMQERAATTVAATEGLAAAAATTAEAEEGDAVDEVVQSEINLRVAASKGDMAAILIAEQEAYNIRTASQHLTKHCHSYTIVAAPAPQPPPTAPQPHIPSPTALALSAQRCSPPPRAPHSDEPLSYAILSESPHTRSTPDSTYTPRPPFTASLGPIWSRRR